MGNPQFRVIRPIASLPITANGTISYDLPRDYDYEALGLRISASLQVTVLATSVRAEAPCQLVPRVEVVADGKNTIVSVPFWALSLGNAYRKMTDQGGRVTTPPTGVAVATYAVEAIGYIDFATLDGQRPKDSNFRGRGLSLFQLKLTYGAAGDCFVGGTVALTGTNVVDVFALNTVEDYDLPPAEMTTPIAIKKMSFLEQALTSSNVAQEIRLPAGNLIRSVLIRTEGATTAGEPDVATLNKVDLKTGVDTRLSLSGANLRALTNAQMGLVTAGYYNADFMYQGQCGNNMIANCWDVSGVSDPKMVLDVVGSANRKMQAVITEYIMARR